MVFTLDAHLDVGFGSIVVESDDFGIANLNSDRGANLLHLIDEIGALLRVSFREHHQPILSNAKREHVFVVAVDAVDVADVLVFVF